MIDLKIRTSEYDDLCTLNCAKGVSLDDAIEGAKVLTKTIQLLVDPLFADTVVIYVSEYFKVKAGEVV